MKQKIDFEVGEQGLPRGYYIRDYDFPHPIGPFDTIADAHDWLIAAQKELNETGFVTGVFDQR
jgi:hypothetical protein